LKRGRPRSIEATRLDCLSTASGTQRAYEKYKKELNDSRPGEKPPAKLNWKKPACSFQLADTQGLAYDPRKDAFVFSLPFIKAQPSVITGSILAKEPNETIAESTT